MGVMDKFLNAMRLNSDEDDYYDDDFYDEEEDEDEEDDYEPRRRNPFRGRGRGREDDFDDEDEEDQDDDDGYSAPRRTLTSRSNSQQPASKVTPMRAVRRTTGSNSYASSSMEVCVIKPVSVEDAREITETLISNRTVILNLEGLDLDIAQRIIDFTSGSCYAISGSLQKISNYIFVVTPANVDISGDIQTIMSSFGGSSSIQSDI